MKKFNVMHIITKLELGGAQQNTLDTVRYLDRNKYNLYLISGTEGILVEDAKKIKDAKVILMPELRHEISPFYDILCLFKLIKLFRKEKIDIVHTHSSKAGILGRFAGKLGCVPIIIHTIHGFSFNDFQNFIVKNFYILFEKIAAAFTDSLVAVTKKDIEKGLNAGVGIKDKYTVIRSGIDIGKFKNTKVDPIKKKEELNIKNTSWSIVGMIACFKPQKSPLDFIKAADIVIREFPETYFLLVGDGELKSDIEELVKKLNLSENIIFAGWRDDINEVIRIFDIFVLTSLWEGLPRSIIQAFAANIPVVATKVDGSSEIIEDGINGYLTTPGYYEETAEKIKTLLKDKELAKKIAKNGFDKLNNFADEFDYKGMVKNIDSLYTKLLSRINL